MKYRSTKTYGHELGLSACFRQWRADSHCSQLHGYALAFTLVFEAEELDTCNWVVDFGSLKPVKAFLTTSFDHRLIMAADDPERETLIKLHGMGVANLLIIPQVGCEAFAKYVADFVSVWLYNNYGTSIRLVSVECREHGANSALWVA